MTTLAVRTGFSTSEEWLDALLGVRTIHRDCKHCGRQVGPYHLESEARSGLATHCCPPRSAFSTRPPSNGPRIAAR